MSSSSVIRCCLFKVTPYWTKDTDHPGNDLGPPTPEVKTAELWQVICQMMGDCQFFTYDTAAGNCQPKSASARGNTSPKVYLFHGQ